VKLCSADLIDHLVQRALPGIALTHVPSPPSAIPVKLNYQYFSLSATGGAWEAVKRARNVAAYVPGEFLEPQLELIILLPQAAA
jgi:type VI secretion system protein ImpJ